MPKAKRAPIEYTPQFGGGIFRSKEAIADELAALEDLDANDASDGLAEAQEVGGIPETPVEPSPAHAPTRSSRTSGRTNERTNERVRVRHSFDIWQDQLLGLTEIQARRFSQSGRKPKLGELVQEALDAYITKERKRSNERTNER